MDLGLTGRTVVVTGASSGVGLETARMLLGEGANVAACARDGDRLARALDGLPGRLHTGACDVLDDVAVREFVEQAAETFGGVDGVVNNAGRSLMARLDETEPQQWRDELDLKIFSVLHVVRAALPWLRRSDAGAVVNVNAILARQPEARLAATSAARAALLNLTKTLAGELAADAVRVNSVCLGLIDTGQWRRRHEASGSTSDFEAWSAGLAADRGIPLGRLGSADEVAYAIVALLSPRASYITGSALDVGGGIARYA
ncbi:NAD(P)-dependent dehydrogenase, short-chain alcohol dehydrogenase family [Saccharopolyspora antimicrobica]|uniref:NAD(P)-dependent dehydrogenase (Short-subunit alcohol dehydrogenase family) n=1 Tax=Saccharopolyspora antimicrobica TaxID=455193 RepID=A0A1I4W0J5_9PSEU|nr:SDR family oxidoreductase [Saccharopolyspora antimicrobica]RKT87137.1 NAD(P)-dependent dehydrogenase (short-subunit alcohol dehydrogenase family) [Saccharopolyspora antimicrobica]SFN06776.1 NAD(P)-dependent dehydrogenase, short-chain alcohol dehydrogenase family [Saccharopolyspora antimicrobica]